MPLIKISPTGQEIQASIGDSILAVSKKEQGGILYHCDGVPSCAMCRVKIISGEEFLTPISRKEEDLIGTAYYITRQRLGCQAKIIQDGVIEIDISDHIEHKERMKHRVRPVHERVERRERPAYRAKEGGAAHNQERGDPRREGDRRPQRKRPDQGPNLTEKPQGAT